MESVGDGAFSLEMPDDAPVVEVMFDGALVENPTDDADGTGDEAASASASEAIDGIASALSRASTPARPPLPSYAVVIIGGLSLACLALCVALIAALSRPEAPQVATPPVEIAAPTPAPEAAATTSTDTEGTAASPADFPAPSVPIPADLITDIEAASDEPLEVELGYLLAAIQHGFGTQSARLEPTLRPYVYRMAARFEWNPDTHRVAVTAPDARLAEARKTLLEGLFEDAIATGRLEIGTGTGPHDITLVTS